MSFSEAFHPDNKDILKTEEEAPYVSGKAIDGAKVGGDKPQDKTDKSSENKDKEDTGGDKKETKKIASIEEMEQKNIESKAQLSDAVKNNPDWPPKSQNPESAKAEADALEKSLNALV